MYPLDDFEAVLSRDNRDAWNASDEVLQGNGALLCFITQLQWAELCCIAFWETESYTHGKNPMFVLMGPKMLGMLRHAS